MEKRDYVKWGKSIGLFLAIIVIALFLEAAILDNVNTRNANKTSHLLLNQVVSVIKKNKQNENELIQSLKEDYMVRAKAVSYILDANPKAEYDVAELQKIAALMSIDEIHLFDQTGTIYSGSIPKYYGYSFDSGEQMAYFKPMLQDKELTMCQDVTPNTSEGKSMMYAITWNSAGDKMIQVGIAPVRLLEELKQNEVSTVVSNMPMYEGINIYVADKDSGKIYGATDESKIGNTLNNIEIYPKQATRYETVFIDNEKYNCIFETNEDYIIGVTVAASTNMENNIIALITLAIYLSLASGFILFMLSKVLKANQENKEQFAILSSMSEIYYSMRLVNLENNTIVKYSSQDDVKEIGKVYQNADDVMHQLMMKNVHEAYLKKAYLFTDLTTIAQRMQGRKILSGEFVSDKLGWFRASFITIETAIDKKPVKMIFTIQSIEGEKRKEEKLIQISNTDELTSCFNRRAYEKDISKLSPDTNFTYVSMDVNGLKVVNDNKGHAAGDELLQGAASCMKQCFEPYGKVYRIGGDEFVSILFTDEQHFKNIKEKFEQTVSKWSGQMVPSMTISCGFVASTEQPWNSIDDIAKEADDRMYQTKAAYYKSKGIVKEITRQ